MQVRIRGKFIGILLIAAVLPLSIALIAIEILGYRYYKGEHGRSLQSMATFLATTIDHNLSKEVEKLDDWLELSPLISFVGDASASVAHQTDAELAAQVVEIDRRWASLTAQSPELVPVLTNELAQALRQFQRVNPLFAEIFVTDNRGRLIAATHKTTDYWQSDEIWWQRARTVRPGRVYLEGIHYDQSARVYSVDVCLPVAPRSGTNAAPTGILKAVLNSSPLFSSVPGALADDGPSREVINADGDVLFELYSRLARRIPDRIQATSAALVTHPWPGWTTTPLGDDTPELVGHAPIYLGSPLADPQVPTGVAPLFVIVHDAVDSVLAPVRRQILLLAASGIALILLFTWVGYYIATRKIIGPLEVLRGAAMSLAESAKLAGPAQAELPEPASPQAQRVLAELQGIDTRDEIEELARDFSAMSRRVLSYHEQLEDEIAAKTASIQEDLQFAREFQEALMPRSYPQVGSRNPAHPLRLNFHHVYKPTSSVGGDFFDVLKLSDTRAGVFIADVMGHGARSALVTAILRTLLQDFAEQGNDPAKFLALINQHFINITGQGNQFVFVSAFYLIVDTDKSIATYASAGHPSPYLADRARRRVTPLIERLENNPALGLFPTSTYTNFTSFLKADDVFILFTDGVFEAGDGTGEQFGRDRLRQVIEDNLDLDVHGLCQSVVTSLNEFTGSSTQPDDICIVGVEATATPSPAFTAPAPR